MAPEPRRAVASPSLVRVDQFLKDLSTQGMSRVSLATAAKALRRFARYGYQRGWCQRDWSSAILSPHLFRHETLPVGPAWSEVQRLLAATEGDTRREMRNRAILWLLAVYGLRSGEVRALRLTDVDWTRRILRVRRSKTARVQEYPLTATMAKTLSCYLENARPESRCREVFLTLRAPFRPLSGSGMYDLTRSLFDRLAIASPNGGRTVCAMPAPRICSTAVCPSSRSGINWDIGAPMRRRFTPRSIWPVCAPSPRSIWGDCYETATRGGALPPAQTFPGLPVSKRKQGAARLCTRDGEEPCWPSQTQGRARFPGWPGPVTRNWICKWTTLRGFYDFALARGWIRRSPLPLQAPKLEGNFTPYIYSPVELRGLLQAATPERTKGVSPETMRTLLLLLYGAGLRLSEALNLEDGDVDLDERLLYVRCTSSSKAGWSRSARSWPRRWANISVGIRPVAVPVDTCSAPIAGRPCEVGPPSRFFARCVWLRGCDGAMAPVTNPACMICGTRRRCIVWKRGIARGLMCRSAWFNSPPIWATSAWQAHSNT